MNIAIDGPAGAGKSTIAKLLAKKLGYLYVDTGAMYRSIALYFLENDINLENEDEIRRACEEIELDIKYNQDGQQIFLNKENVTAKIRQEQVGNMASKVAAKKIVRDRLLALQRNLARENDVVMDGRDIGTFVLPDARIKIYLTASVAVRAKRRYDELALKGEKPDIATIEADIEKRDYQDMNRDIAPLRQAEDGIYLDSSDMDIEQVVDYIYNMTVK